MGALRVLLVDDYEPYRACVAHFLRTRLGAEVIEAGDGLVALEHTKAGTFDVILLDIEMPTMDGAETFGRLDPVHAARTLFVTAGGRGEREAWLLRFEAEGRVLRKPVDLDRLTKAMAGLRS